MRKWMEQQIDVSLSNQSIKNFLNGNKLFIHRSIKGMYISKSQKKIV